MVLSKHEIFGGIYVGKFGTFQAYEFGGSFCNYSTFPKNFRFERLKLFGKCLLIPDFVFGFFDFEGFLRMLVELKIQQFLGDDF